MNHIIAKLTSRVTTEIYHTHKVLEGGGLTNNNTNSIFNYFCLPYYIKPDKRQLFYVHVNVILIPYWRHFKFFFYKHPDSLDDRCVIDFAEWY